MKAIAALAAIAMLLSGCGSSENMASTSIATSSTSPSPQSGTSMAPHPTATDTDAPSPASPPASLKPHIPLFNAVCGGGIEVHADEGGPVFIDGQQTSLKKFNDNYYEASRGGLTISISIRPDGSLSLSFSGPHRANGICTLK